MTRINCVGDICPVPVIKTKKAIAEADISQGLEVVVDNEIAVQNISKFLNSKGCAYSTSQEGGNFVIAISQSASQEIKSSGLHNYASNDNGIIIVISSQFMGTGDDALGKLLMKGFIFAVSQLETLPTAIIFYNSGVYHALKNSDSVKDLQAMHEQGVKIISCGTCLNHYNLLGDLAVGEVTDMYNIVNLMQQAVNIIRP